MAAAKKAAPAAKKAAAKKAAAPKKVEQQPDAAAVEEQEQPDAAVVDEDRGPAPARAEMQGEPPRFGREGEEKAEETPVAAHESGAAYADGTPVPEIVDASTAAFSNGLNPVSGEKVVAEDE